MTSEKREKAIKYLTEEIRSLRMAPEINGCPMTPEWAEQLEIMETCLEAVRSTHFADAGKMQPLNFEQLWKMDGQPVRIVCDEAAKETTPGFEPLEMIVLVEYIKTAGCVILRNNIGGVSEYYSDEELQQDGLTAYAYHPAHIDREAWTECDRCKGKENALDQFRSHDFQIDGSEIYFHDTENGWEGEEIHFCPWCGRPLTEEAWDELEKRLRG